MKVHAACVEYVFKLDFIIEVVVFRVVRPCSVVVGYQRFRHPCCLHLHPEDGKLDLIILFKYFVDACALANMLSTMSSYRTSWSWKWPTSTPASV
jgi:hypothetical protein